MMHGNKKLFICHIFFFFELFFPGDCIKAFIEFAKKRHKSGVVSPRLLACKHFYSVTHSVWLKKTSSELQSILCKNKGCWGSFCKSAGKISLGLKEANLNIACVQKL